MRLTRPSRFERLGSIQINELQRVIELDAGSGRSTSSSLTVSRDDFLAIESRMAIVVLCMNEEFRTIESVFSGIPHDCLIVLVSNSNRTQGGYNDRYETEVNILQNFCREADRFAIAVHQKDPGVADAFAAAGAPELVSDGDGLVHSGKGEGMLVGMAVAALMEREYVGFVDADNYIPGSINEYCKSYAAGFHLSRATAEYAMVRVSWSSKPKERNGRLMFDRRGRSSRVVNEWLNNLLQEFSGYGTDCITTGNAGEHAMTMSLALKLRMASGFAVEPYEYLYLLEQMGDLDHHHHHQNHINHQRLDDDNNSDTLSDASSPISPSSMSQLLSPPASPVSLGGGSSSSRSSSRNSSLGRNRNRSNGSRQQHASVQIHQIETRNPHLHDNKGDEHVSDMRAQALHMLYHSPMTPAPMKAALRKWMEDEGVLAVGGEVPRERVYPALGELDMARLAGLLGGESVRRMVGGFP
ncbi:mannosyl-3-phosphoglycerate synthase [Colletotrichum lupini]|uniref:Mannosyl-3-phosphoglycerate synthase n=1 Tax=Colletotrichum lupini TaxID=145971 RepID=A0A9Q8WLG6_9PEZI|nr:mannosyl-3-phosphoglycerate synthase [Colletotrichum lupini]UQC87142.1 mannosyl-3-phosphoglycerate synthase [Colletotrichum lupini]